MVSIPPDSAVVDSLLLVPPGAHFPVWLGAVIVLVVLIGTMTVLGTLKNDERINGSQTSTCGCVRCLHQRKELKRRERARASEEGAVE